VAAVDAAGAEADAAAGAAADAAGADADAVDAAGVYRGAVAVRGARPKLSLQSPVGNSSGSNSSILRFGCADADTSLSVRSSTGVAASFYVEVERGWRDRQDEINKVSEIRRAWHSPFTCAGRAC
jgi:hypothetical protein